MFLNDFYNKVGKLMNKHDIWIFICAIVLIILFTVGIQAISSFPIWLIIISIILIIVLGEWFYIDNIKNGKTKNSDLLIIKILSLGGTIPFVALPIGFVSRNERIYFAMC